MTDTKADIKAAILEELARNQFAVFGLRAHPVKVAVGDEIPNSHDWDHENDVSSDEELPGASTIGIDTFDEDDLDDEIALALKRIETYSGEVVLVTGSGMTNGEDHGEWVIKDPKVLLVLYARVLEELTEGGTRWAVVVGRHHGTGVHLSGVYGVTADDRLLFLDGDPLVEGDLETIAVRDVLS